MNLLFCPSYDSTSSCEFNYISIKLKCVRYVFSNGFGCYDRYLSHVFNIVWWYIAVRCSHIDLSSKIHLIIKCIPFVLSSMQNNFIKLVKFWPAVIIIVPLIPNEEWISAGFVQQQKKKKESRIIDSGSLKCCTFCINVSCFAISKLIRIVNSCWLTKMHYSIYIKLFNCWQVPDIIAMKEILEIQ